MPLAFTIPCVAAAETNQPADQRREALKLVFEQAQHCVRCQELAATRNNVVFGAGNADAELMFVGEAPGASEDERGLPFVGRAGKLLETLLNEIGLERKDVFIANVLKCRPPGNRDPLPVEIENCREYLYSQVELIQPRVICSLGNFSTKLLRADPTGITRLHGKPEELTLGRRTVRLYPIFHPAAALYTPRMLETLREDFSRLPELLALPEPEQPDLDIADEPPQAAVGDGGVEEDRHTGSEQATAASAARAEDAPPSGAEQTAAADQLGLF
jgi:uracil-DNA glycosylase family 4